MKKVLVASDSFKGTMESVEIGNAFKKLYPSTHILSISDGGEGFVDSLLFNSKEFGPRIIDTVDDLLKKKKVTIAVRERTAFIDIASVIALNNYPLEKHLEKNSRGIGIILKELENDKNIDTVNIGLGGSSTSDIGFYASLELGFKYLDINGNQVTKLEDSASIKKIIKPKLKNKYIALSDVDNPLLGENGSLEIFGRQKGFSEHEIKEYEKHFSNIANLINRKKINVPGAGAAGGLGFFVLAHLNGKIKSGIKEMIRATRFKEVAKNFDLIITGEGAFDNQSFHGKAPIEIAKAAPKNKTILIAGIINADKEKLRSIYKDWYQLKREGESISEAIKNTRKNLEIVISKIIKKYLESK